MRAFIPLLAAVLAAAHNLPASATVRITADPGGQLGPYLKKLQNLRNSGENVLIDGPCLSACTMLLGIIPHERICVTARARLGFHAAWRPDQAGRRTSDQDGTELLMSVYPQQVRDWINRRGGLSPQLIYLGGEELATMYSRCNGSNASASVDWHPAREQGRSRFDVEQSQSTSAARAATRR